MSTAARRFGGSVLDDLAARVQPTAATAAQIPLDAIEPDPNQPRRQFDQGELAMLAESIRLVGVLQPIGVVALPAAGCYRLRFGERRWHAARLAGLDAIPAVLVEGDKDVTAVQVIENQHRARLTNRELADAVRRLSEQGMSNQAIASALAISDPQALRYYRALDKLPTPLAPLVDRAAVRALYELCKAWEKGDAAAAVVSARIGALPEDEELTITVARRIVGEATGKHAGTFEAPAPAQVAPPPQESPAAAPASPSARKTRAAASAPAEPDVDAERVARVRAWLDLPDRPRPPLAV